MFLNIYHLLLTSGKQTIPQEISLAFPWILWKLWKARNSLIFKNVRMEPQEIVSKALDEADGWLRINGILKDDSTEVLWHTDIQCLWQKPLVNILKCNIGASWVLPNRNYGVAWLVRDHQGEAVFHSRRAYSAITTQGEAELLSLLWAVESLAAMKQKNIAFEIWSLNYIPKEGNRAADAIALSVTRDHRYQSYISQSGPFWLNSLLIEEAKGNV
ncbi:unnamed protein product [Thlaspi arvense]|uniref:RNase H type-1 domain-containing protein n=1 Tax=Thlaspi arvense TaxID=13288 RepID=A0AAU9SDV2_THLAR|nr:unnamed protein product [Thlaspi arvense]